MNSSNESSGPSHANSAWAPHPWTPWIAVAATLVLVAFLEVRRRPPKPLAADAPARVFSAERAFAVLETILGATDGEVKTHPTGSDAAVRVRERVADQLAGLGVVPEALTVQKTVACRDSERWSFVACAPVANLVARLPGPTEGPAVVLMSHYDSVGAGPGVSDDAVGVAAMLEAVRALLAEDPRGETRLYPVVVLVTDAEEVGLFGARGFVDRHPLTSEGGIGAVINLEARGTGGQSLLFQASADDAWIIDAYRSAASRPATSSLYAEIYRRLPNDTDLSVFLDAGIAGVNFAYAEGVQRYHTPRDDLVHLERGSLQHHGDNLLAMTRALATHPRLADPPSGRAVYTDIASYFVLAYPLSWALPLAVVALLGMLALIIVSVRRGEARPRALLLALAALLAMTVAAIAVGVGYGRLVAFAVGSERPAWAHPLPFRAGLWALVFSALAVYSSGLRRLGDRFLSLRTSAWTAALASWLCLGLLGVALAVVTPGVSLFAVLPALALVVVAAVAVLRSSSPRLRDTAVLTGALATAFFWLNMARGLEMGMGLHATALVAVPLTICSWPYASVFFTHSPWTRRAPTLGLAALTLVCLSGAMAVAPYTEADPQGFNVVHFEDAASAETVAEIFVSSGADVPPSAVLEAADFTRDPEPAPSGLRLGKVYSASTEPLAFEPPSLDVVAVEEIPEGRRVRFHLLGPRADFLRLYLPETAAPIRALVGGYDIRLEGKEPVEGRHLIYCTGPSCDEVEFSLDVAGNEAIEAELYAIRYASVHGLPEGAERVAEARPPWAVPVHSGDRTAVRSLVALPAVESSD